MKTAIKYIFQTLLGFQNYLYFFSRYKIRTLRSDKKEGDFFYFLGLLPPSGTVLDIGANIGIMTVHLARNSSRTVIAFEPMPYNLIALKRVIQHYKLSEVQVMEYALGNTEGFLEMVMPMVGPVRMQGLSHVVHDSIKDHNQGEKVTVPVHRLDDIQVLRETTRVTGIKMDVENFEFYVLDGAQELLAKHHPVLYIELWDNENRYQCFQLLKKLDYSIFVVEQGKLVPFDKQEKQNFIFIPGVQSPLQGEKNKL
jgi:FkbM family methyltransferase